MPDGKRWTIQDRNGNLIYLTNERWRHIADANNHPEMVDYEDQVQITIRRGRRRQELLNPRKYRYTLAFDNLPDDSNHVVVIVVFGYHLDDYGFTRPNNYVATVFFKHIRLKGNLV